MQWKIFLFVSFLPLLYLDDLYWEFWLCVSVIVAAFILYLERGSGLYKIACPLLLICLALSYSQWRADRALSAMLSEEQHASIVRVVGKIVSPVQQLSIPSHNELPASGVTSTASKDIDNKTNNSAKLKLRFTLDVFENNTATLQGLKRIQVNYYPNSGKNNFNVSDLKYGDLIDARIKLRAIRGTAVPGAFDIRKYALSQDIQAHGTLQEMFSTQEDSATKLGFIERRFDLSGGLVDFRRRALNQIEAVASDIAHYGVVKAILFGEQDAIDAETDELLQSTGTRHLLAVSGLHIGIAMGLFVVVARGLTALYPKFSKRMTVAPISILGGFVYLCLAGFPISGMRAFLMATVAIFIYSSGIQTSRWNALLSAAVTILLISPVAILANAFWLSFAAVAFLLLGLGFYDNSGRHLRDTSSVTGALDSNSKQSLKLFAKTYQRFRMGLFALKSTVKLLLMTQIILFLAMPLVYAPMGIYSGPLTIAANLVVVPLYSFLIIPLGFLAALLTFLANLSIDIPFLELLRAAHFTFECFDWLVQCSIDYLSYLNNVGSEFDWDLGPNLWPFAVYLLAIMLSLHILQGKHMPAFKMATLIYLFILFPSVFDLETLDTANEFPKQKSADRLNRNLQPGDLSITQIDVGQGSAYLISSASQHWLYDTGPSFLFGGDAGLYSVIPLLEHYGIRQLSGVIVSHGDNDHIGGLDSILQAVEVDSLYVSESKKTLNHHAEATHTCLDLNDSRVIGKDVSLRSIWPQYSDSQQKRSLYTYTQNTDPQDKAPQNKPPQNKVPQNTDSQSTRLEDKRKQALALGHLSMNDQSCVIQICEDEHKNCLITLSGDISAQSEMTMSAAYRENLASNVLTIAHHGSISSSSHVFLDLVGPRWGFISSGWRNRYKHPHTKVMQRLTSRDITALESSVLGTVQLIYRSKKQQWQGPFCSRYQAKHFWETRVSHAKEVCVAGLI